MRIAQAAPPFEPVPPTTYGGTERVIHILTEELVRRGHDVTLFASGDSRTSARLVPVVDQALWHHDQHYQDMAPFWSLVVGRLWQRVGEFDVVHSHVDCFAFPFARAAPTPVVTTLHGRLDMPELQPVYREFAELPLVSISHAQRAPVAWANFVATVYHGIELTGHAAGAGQGGYLVFLGRVSPGKGLDVAIRVARRVGMLLKVAARLPLQTGFAPDADEDRAYYEQVIVPLLRESGVEVIGEVGGRDKIDLLGGAAALLFPISWPEPFGLVMAEALASGTPVVAFRRGSVPEVIAHGETGFACDTEDEMVAAVQRIDRIDRRHCRAEAERRFSPAAMAEGYERVYERLIDTRRRSRHVLA